MASPTKRLILKFGCIQGGACVIAGVIAPVLFLLFMSKGIDLYEMGVLLAVATSSAVVFEIPFGAVADRYGRKKTFLIGELSLIIVVVGFWWADSFEALIVFMFLNGVSTALFSGTIDALFVEQFKAVSDTEKINLMEAQASLGIYQMIGLAAGAVTSGLIPLWFIFLSDSYDFIGFYEVNFVVLLPLLMIHMLFAYCYIDESTTVSSHPQVKFLQNIGGTIKNIVSVVVRNPAFKSLLVIDFMAGVAFISLEQLWQPMLSTLIDSKATVWLFGVLVALNYICMALGQGISIPLAKVFKHNYSTMLLVVEMSTGLLFLIFAMQGQLYGFVGMYLLMHVFIGIAEAPSLAMFHEKIPESHRSTMLSVKSLVGQAGAMLGALLAGYLAKFYGISFAWTVAGGIFIVSSLFYLRPAILTLSKDMAITLNGKAQSPTD